MEQEPNGGAASLNTHTGVYIHHNVISQYKLAGIGIYGFNNTRIENNTIEISAEDAGITFYSGDPVNTSLSGFQTFVKNNIIVKNFTYGIDNRVPSLHTFISDYNCIDGNLVGNYNDVTSTTDIYTDPLLACEYYFDDVYDFRYYNATSYYILSPLWWDCAGQENYPICRGDLGANEVWEIYHLESEFGRWNGTEWFMDTITSPCIDAGYPASDYSNEPSPNGERINLGAFGNTEYSSKSDEVSSIQIDPQKNVNVLSVQIGPNPFNPSLQIKFSLHEVSNVSIDIYNVSGQFVGNLLNEIKKAGLYNINWDASNMTAGMYFIRAKAGDFIETRKCLLVK